MQDKLSLPRTRTLENLSPIGRVSVRTITSPTVPAPIAVEQSRSITHVIDDETLGRALALSMGVVARTELAERVRRKLAENGASSWVIERVIRPGFFAHPDGLENVARALGVLADDEVVVDEVR